MRRSPFNFVSDPSKINCTIVTVPKTHADNGVPGWLELKQVEYEFLYNHVRLIHGPAGGQFLKISLG